MTTSSRHKWRAGVLLALAAGLLPHPAASETGLLERCWPAAALAGRAGEQTPVKGAPGHAQRIPGAQLPATAPVPAHQPGVIRRVALPPGQKLVALTIDLCEASGEISGYDGAVFDYLRASGVRATVFAGGKWMMTHPERAQQLIADPRLEIASHGWAHRNVRGLAGSELAAEIRGPESAFQAQRKALVQRQCVAQSPAEASRLQARLSLYRFPFGACNAEALSVLAQSGLMPVQWDVSTGDSSRAETAQAIAATLLNEVRPGSIILAHGNGRGHHTAAALPIAIPKLRARGFVFVTVSELLAAGRPVTAESCYDRRPGDTDRYDALFPARRPRSEPSDGRSPPPALPR